MITIRHPAAGAPPVAAPDRPSIHLLPAAGTPIPWGGLRQLLARLRPRLGDDVLGQVIRPQRAMLSLVLRGLDGELSDEERRLRGRQQAQVLGFLSHNGMIGRRLLDAWIEVVGGLLARAPSLVEVHDAELLDDQSLAVLTQATAAFVDGDSDLLLSPSARGIPDDLLGRRPVEMAWGILASLEARPETRIEEGPAPAADTTAVEEPSSCPWDDRLEQRAGDLLDERRGALGGQEARLVLAAVRAAFASFAFHPALVLALRLLERRPPLADEERKEVHLLLALSAYNRQVQGLGNLELAALLDEHFAAALALETDPAQRSHLLYRLCINRSRRQGDYDDGLRLGGEAIAAAGDPRIDGSTRDLLRAWALNGRAYVLARRRRFEEAITDCEEALGLLEGLAAAREPAAEVLPSRMVIADNLAELARLAGDRPRALAFQARFEAIEGQTDAGFTISPNRWSTLLRAEGDLRGAARHVERGLASARAARNPVAEDRYAADLGDLRYRMGDAEGAREAFAACLRIRRRIASPRDLLRTEINAALADLRAGRLEEAAASLGRVLEHPLSDTASARAEVRGALALALARLGRSEAAEAVINLAIEEAVEAGERDALVRIARMAGEVARALGRVGEAEEAFARAVAIADETGGGPAGDLLAALLGLGAAEGAEARTVRALELAPAALVDADAWWELGALLPRVAALAEGRRLGGEPAAQAARWLARAAAARADCAAAAVLLAEALDRQP